MKKQLIGLVIVVCLLTTVPLHAAPLKEVPTTALDSVSEWVRLAISFWESVLEGEEESPARQGEPDPPELEVGQTMDPDG